MSKIRTVDIDGEIVTVDTDDAKLITRAVELLALVSKLDAGVMDFGYWETFQREQTVLLLSLETGISETVLMGAVQIAYKIYKGENLIWTRWTTESKEYFPLV
jgi:hypothetical protein